MIDDGTHLDRVGGIAGLEAILADFYDRVFDDPMIGFMFRSTDKRRLVEKEAEMAAKALGAAEVKYTGRPMRDAHQKHRIMGGQFARRLQILRETLDDHGVPDEVKAAWLAHNEALRKLITKDPGSACEG